MPNVIISKSKSWISKWNGLLGLVKPDSPVIHCDALQDFFRIRLQPLSVIFIDTQSVGLPKYLPYNPSPYLNQCNFVLANTGGLPEKAMLHFLKTGYSGVLHGEERPEDELKALENLLNNRIWFPRAIVEQAVRDYQTSNTSQEQVVFELAAAYELSKREQQVCMALLDGHKNSEIARRLFISKHTVKCHVTNMYRKLGVSSRHDILTLVNQRMKRQDSLGMTG